MKDLVEGLNIDERTIQTDCQACTEAKAHKKPYPKVAERKATCPGQITHLDISGKIPVESIHGNHYFMALVDEYTHRVKVDPLRTKDESTKRAKNYLTYLKAHEMNPEEIQIDGGGKF